MIVRARPKPWELPFFWRLSILPRIAGPISLVMLSAALVLLLEHRDPGAFSGWTVAHFTLLGIALSIFLGFRNSACYERWWEARRQLGALIGEMRSLARMAVTLPGGDRVRRAQVVRLAIGYTYALMAHLRTASMPPEVVLYGCASAQAEPFRNAPDAILRSIAALYGAMLSEGEIGEQVWRAIDDHIAAITSIQVACERIKTTPAPFTYTLLLHRTAYAFCLLLPFGLASTLGYATPFFCAVVAYAFFGLDALADELEEPFGSSLNALPLTAMARTVEISLLEALGAKDIPEPLQPVHSVLQ